VLAIRAYNHLANGMGGLDWAGLPVVAELLGVVDVEALIHRIQIIRQHKPADEK
jgi:hypothetical protein